jgi:small subunit ribosomal protein S14
MARLAMRVKNVRRIKLANKYRPIREELKKIALDPKVSDEEKFAALAKIQKLPRNSSFTRVRNRCVVTGRQRAFLRKFGLSRIAFRELALRGMIPGVTKSSW